MMPSELENMLYAAGWYPGRRVSVSQWLEELREYGFSIVPQAVAVLEEFGGLKIEPVRTPTDLFSPGPVIVDPLVDAELDRFQDWEEQLKTRLTPVGQFDGQSCLAIAEDGSVYMMWDSCLWKVGSSWLDALENSLLFARRKPVEVLRR
jgi:hypothetical protein